MKKNKIYPMWFLLVPLALYSVFFLLPSILGIGYSFTDWNSRSMGEVNFVGLENYIEIFTSDKDYLSGIGHTLMFTVISNIVKLIPALFLAIMLNEGIRGKGLYRTLLYLPSILPYVIIGILFTSILNYNNGMLNSVLEFLHLDFLKQKWLSDLNVVWKSIFGVDAWRGVGYVMTIFIAGLSTIPRSYYEAAQIDGASELKTFYSIMFPLSRPVVATISLFTGLCYWNDWTNGLYYVDNEKLFSIQLLLMKIMNNIQALKANTALMGTGTVELPGTSVRMAMAFVGILPILIVYPFVQKYLVEGVVIGAVKG